MWKFRGSPTPKYMSFVCMPLVSPEVAIDSVKARRDIDSAPAALREIADEVKQGNIDMTELSQFIAAVMPHCLHSENFTNCFQNLGTTRFSRDAGAFLSTHSRHSIVA